MSLARHNVAACAHAARHDPDIADPRTNGTFARHPNVSAVVVFFGDIVVMAIHDLGGHCERREVTRQCGQNQFEHRLAVLHGIGVHIRIDTGPKDFLPRRHSPDEQRLYERIYAVVRLIPPGKAAAYGQIAAIVGDCTARMVGYAMASVPTGSDVPWQRVINAQGKVSPAPTRGTRRCSASGCAPRGSNSTPQARSTGTECAGRVRTRPGCSNTAIGSPESSSMHLYTVTTLQPEHFAGLEELQRLAYPDARTAGTHARRALCEPVCRLPGGPDRRPATANWSSARGRASSPTSISRTRAHTFREICDNFYFRTHDPHGAWYYGADISVHPAYRGRGLGKLIYQARKDLVRRHEKRGIVAGGMLPGYAEYRGKLTVPEYVARVVAGALIDPTLTFQLRQGFVVRGLLEDYIDDSAADNWATLIVWENPDFRPGGAGAAGEPGR